MQEKILTGLVAEPENTIIELSELGAQVRVAFIYRGLDFALLCDPDKLDEIGDAFKAAAEDARQA